MKGRFITFEGGEGTGKSTQIALLSDFLQFKNVPFITTREPGGTEGAEKIRDLLVTGDVNRWDPKTELLLMLAARRDHLYKKILPNIEKNIWVLCDRFHDSTIAYQGYGHGTSLDLITFLSKNFIDGYGPDRTYIFLINPEEGLERTLSREDKEDRFEKMGLSFHERIRAGYLEIAKAYPKRCNLIDASQSIETIAEEIVKDLRTTFNL